MCFARMALFHIVHELAKPHVMGSVLCTAKPQLFCGQPSHIYGISFVYKVLQLLELCVVLGELCDFAVALRRPQGLHLVPKWSWGSCMLLEQP